MVKKRMREAEGQEAPVPKSNPDKMDEDASEDEDVS